MSTQAAQQYNFDDTWTGILQSLKADSAAQVISMIQGERDLKRRNAWFRFCYQGFSFREWDGKNLDAMTAVGEAAIANALACAEVDGDGIGPEQKTWWTDQANAHCYNVSANLADCWEDGFTRETRHFEKGLELALRAEAFRVALNKPAGSRAMAAWAKGKHLLSLGRLEKARAAFEENLSYEMQVAAEQGTPKTLVKEAHFGLILCHGFLGLCDLAAKNAAGNALYDGAIAAFEAKKQLSSDDKEDAESGIAQLRASRKQMGLYLAK